MMGIDPSYAYIYRLFQQSLCGMLRSAKRRTKGIRRKKKKGTEGTGVSRGWLLVEGCMGRGVTRLVSFDGESRL